MFGYDVYTWIPIFLSLILGLFTLLYCYIARNDNYWKKRGVPYAPRMNVISGLRMIYKKPINEIIIENYKKYGRVVGAFEWSKPNISVSDPDLLRDILVKDFHKFHNRVEIDMADPLTSKMVSVLQGEDWKRVRTIITPAFTSKRMRQMGSIINECSKSVIQVCEDCYKEGKPVECKGIFGAFTMDVIAKSAFGTQIDSQSDPENIFVTKVKQTFLEPKLLTILMLLVAPNWLLRKSKIFSIDKENFFQNVVKQVIKERKKTGKKYNDMLQILMDAADENESLASEELDEDETDRFGSITEEKMSSPSKYKKLSEIELLAQCVLFFFVGYETTASTLTFMAYALAMNPEWQEKLIAEVDKAFRKNSEMSHDTVRDLKILDAVVSETLRMYPVALVTVRTADEDYELGSTGIVIEKGIRVNIPIYGMHYDPEFFEDPEKFNPERFLDSSAPKHPQYAYLPFGAGPRNCLGMRFALLEIKVCIANILRHFRFRQDPTTKVPIEYKKGVGLLSVTDLHLALEKRTDVK